MPAKCHRGGMVDAADLKSAGPQGPWGFESPRWHIFAYLRDGRSPDSRERLPKVVGSEERPSEKLPRGSSRFRLGPGLVMAASGIGASDIITATVAGAKF